MRAVEAMVEAIDGTAAVYGRRLDRDEAVAVGAVDTAFPTGSAIKFAVLLAFASDVADGFIDATQRVEIDARCGAVVPGAVVG